MHNHPSIQFPTCSTHLPTQSTARTAQLCHHLLDPSPTITWHGQTRSCIDIPFLLFLLLVFLPLSRWQVIQLITLSHELGHNFGSSHDTQLSCTPGDTGDSGGNYLMYPAATSGNLRNNLLFSNCSRSDILTVMNKKSGCFTKSTPHCGNGIVEYGEDCDCGLACTNKSCCTSSCTVNTNAGYTCSPQNALRFPCCTAEDGSGSQCQVVSASANKICGNENSCAAASKCNGVVATCPVGTPKPNLVTECGCVNNNCAENPRTGDKVCMGGSCNVSRCALFGAKSCDAVTAPCALACKGSGWGNGYECVSSFNTTARHKNQTWGVHYSSGHVCDGLQGYCTSSGACQRVGSDMEQSWASAAHTYVKAYWWAILLTIVGFVGLQVVVMRLHRMKRRRGYESLDDGASGRWLGPNTKRDDFEKLVHTNGYDTADDDSESDHVDDDDTDTDAEAAVVAAGTTTAINAGGTTTAGTPKSAASEKTATVRHDFYERERRAVIFRAYQREFAEAASEAELEAQGLKLKEVCFTFIEPYPFSSVLPLLLFSLLFIFLFFCLFQQAFQYHQAPCALCTRCCVLVCVCVCVCVCDHHSQPPVLAYWLSSLLSHDNR
jgi:hypothetical protein